MKIWMVTMLWLGACGMVQAASEINKTLVAGLAIKGYDPVAYFTEAKPVKGKKEFSHKWKDATWRFASSENRDLFKARPAAYAPQYGGYCAYAVSQGSTARIDPAQWTIVAEKLYLNYNKKINTKWKAKRDEFIRLADQNWPNVIE